MYIFYDFETSDKDFLGQILSYCFILTDENYQTILELNGLIKPNRTELPSVGAILTNKLNIDHLMENGSTEFDAATNIYQFLESATNEYGAIPLVGFNSARFDFKHFEKLLLKYGLSPTFYGKLGSLDILQFARYCAVSAPNSFPFTKKERDNTPYYSFKLEDLSAAFDCLDAPQTHDARDDVLLTIELLKKLEANCDQSLQTFQKQQKNTSNFELNSTILIESSLAFEQISDTPTIKNTRWLVIGKAAKTTFILVNLDAYEESSKDDFNDYQLLTRYLNLRTTFFHCTDTEPLTDTSILADQHIKRISMSALQYFKLFPVDWDIEYRPWAMGFNNINTLRSSILKLADDPSSYQTIIKELIAYRNQDSKQEEINMMIQLFNRFYLNYHPNPKHLNRYLHPRYIKKTLYRNSEDAICPMIQAKELANLINVDETSDLDKENLIALQNYQKSFMNHISELKPS